MALHLLKLCVGIESVAQLRGFIGERARRAARDESQIHAHVTRMRPSRADDLLDGGSLYWVIKGQISARQRLLALEDFYGADGVRRCALKLDDRVIDVTPRPCRPFQGWRYLKGEDAPSDLLGAGAEMPEDLRRQLSELGLL